MNWLTIMKLQKSKKKIKNYSNSHNIKEVQYDPAPKGEFDFQLSLLPCPDVETSFWKSRVQPTFWMALGCTAEPKSRYPDAIWVEMVELLGGIWQKWINGMVCYWNTTRMGMFYDSKYSKHCVKNMQKSSKLIQNLLESLGPFSPRLPAQRSSRKWLQRHRPPSNLQLWDVLSGHCQDTSSWSEYHSWF